MLQPELKLRRDKIRALMAQQGIDAALITCNVNLIYTYGCVVSGYLYLPLNAPARLFIKRPNDIEGEHIHPIRKPEQITGLLKECGLPLPVKLMLEGDELPFTEYNRLAACFSRNRGRALRHCVDSSGTKRKNSDGNRNVPSFRSCPYKGIRTDSLGLSAGNDRPSIIC